MLAVNQCRKTQTARDCQLKKNGAAKAPACIPTIQPTTTQSTRFQLIFSGSQGSQTGVSLAGKPAELRSGASVGFSPALERIVLCKFDFTRFGDTVDIDHSALKGSQMIAERIHSSVVRHGRFYCLRHARILVGDRKSCVRRPSCDCQTSVKNSHRHLRPRSTFWTNCTLYKGIRCICLRQNG